MTQKINLADYARAAADHLQPGVFGYYAGGADDEITQHQNRVSFERIQLAPRILVNVSERDTSTTILGQAVAAPVMVAPMALMKMAHPTGELGMAKAAGENGLLMVASTLGNIRLEAIAQAATAPLWFQLYVYRDRAITRELVHRAEAAGYRAIVLTVDAPFAGNRERDVRNHFSLPDGIQLANLADFALDAVEDQAEDSAIAAYAASQLDPSLTWADLDWLINLTNLPVLVKGILRPDDARRAIDHGVAGIIVSNHGGRQLDTAPAAIDALRPIADEIGDEAEIIMDGGIRRGTDVLKALAFGAQGVMLGRPALWGLAVDGQAGASHVFQILIEELSRAMALTGCTKISEITRDIIYE